MGFLSYCLSFYRDELGKLENRIPTEAGLYRARQLLRMLDDLADEGYTALNDRLEAAHCGVTKLRKYLARNRVKPFSPVGNWVDVARLHYSIQESELRSAIAQAMNAAAAMPNAPRAPFTENLHQFCRWIGYEHKTAYIFLLRDTLLPFVYCLEQGRQRLYPWLLSRKSFATLTGQAAANDAVRACIYAALESGCTDYPSFIRTVLPAMRRAIGAYPQARERIGSMLADIDAERILVVESGCAGTFPLLLMALDERVDMKMYTTYPYLTDVLGKRVFISRYEENRLFETMAAQALYFRFSGLRNGQFYIQTCTNKAIETRALAEIHAMMQFAEADAPRYSSS